MKLISFNVNGLRAIIGKGFEKWFESTGADIVCIQETKLSAGQLDLAFTGYEHFFSYAQKKGYSGTAVFTRIKPLSVTEGIGIDEHDKEGRTLTLEFDEFYLVDVYVPNSQKELARLDYRRRWNQDFENYIVSLDEKKPVIFTGDLNVAHKEIDIKNTKSNERNAGFTIEEREDFSRLLSRGFIDSFRFLHPDEVKYSWWSYMFKAREKNIGWRIDYFIVSEKLKDRIAGADILTDVMGSDHCPVELILN